MQCALRFKTTVISIDATQDQKEELWLTVRPLFQ
eukprot:COSAG02_NODE_6785_length_3362_cov_5.357953_1_plen_34_part_00